MSLSAFQRMRRLKAQKEAEEKARLEAEKQAELERLKAERETAKAEQQKDEQKKEAGEECQEVTAQSKKQMNTSQDASMLKAGSKQTIQTKKKPSNKQPEQ